MATARRRGRLQKPENPLHINQIDQMPHTSPTNAAAKKAHTGGTMDRPSAAATTISAFTPRITGIAHSSDATTNGNRANACAPAISISRTGRGPKARDMSADQRADHEPDHEPFPDRDPEGRPVRRVEMQRSAEVHSSHGRCRTARDDKGQSDSESDGTFDATRRIEHPSGEGRLPRHEHKVRHRRPHSCCQLRRIARWLDSDLIIAPTRTPAYGVTAAAITWRRES